MSACAAACSDAANQFDKAMTDALGSSVETSASITVIAPRHTRTLR